MHYGIRNTCPLQMQMRPPHWPPQTAAAGNAPDRQYSREFSVHNAQPDETKLFHRLCEPTIILHTKRISA